MTRLWAFAAATALCSEADAFVHVGAGARSGISLRRPAPSTRGRVDAPFAVSMVASMDKTAMEKPGDTETATYTLVLVRHGESTWNDLNKFTGWADCPLSEKGAKEAKECGRLLQESGFTFDLAYTSLLKRAINTLWAVLEETDLMWIPVKRSWRLNERHYGALQGLNKQETVDKFGKEQVMVWRRSYDIPPPALDESSEHYPGNDRRYKDVPRELLPFTESLKLTEERFLVEWEENILPDIKAGKRVLIAAHGNTLRALVKHLDNIPAEDISELNIPTGVPLIYELNAAMEPIPAAEAMAPLRGRYLGDQEAIRGRIQGVKNQTK